MAEKGSFFRSIYSTIVIFVCLGAVIPCITLGGLAASMVRRLMMEYSDKHVAQMASVTTSIADMGKNLAVEVYEDKEIIPLLYGQAPENNEILRGVHRMNTYLRSNSYLESIYVYNRNTGYVYSTLAEGRSKRENFADNEMREFVQGNLDWGKLEPIPRVIDKDAVYSFVCYDDINSKTGQYDHVVVININQEMLESLFLENGKETREEAFIISPDGALVSARSGMQLHADLSGENYIRNILENPGQEGDFRMMVGKSEYLIQFRKMEELGGWVFIDMIDYSVWQRTITNIIFWSIGLIVASSILINFVAYKISQKVYRPIARLEKNFRELKALYNKSGFSIKNAVFQNLLSGNDKIDRKQVEELIEKYHLKLIIESKTKLISILLKEEQLWKGKFDRKDKELVWFAISNICDEIGNRYNPAVSVVMQDKRLIIMMNMEKEYTDEELKEKVIEPVRENLRRFGGFEVQAVIGETAEDMCMLPFTYQDIENCEPYLMLSGQDIITCQDVMERQEKEVAYPMAKEEAYLSCFAAGMQEEADKLCRELICEASGYSYNHFLNVVNHMIYSIWYSFYQKGIKIQDVVKINQKKLLQRVQKTDNIEEIIKEFENINAHMAFYVQEKEIERKQKDNGKIISQIEEIIRTEYGNIDLNIQMIAEKMQMSPAYLGRVYSKNAGRTITEAITDERLKVACRLLKTDQSIQEVGEQCGFCNITYFYRVFKKYFNVTPNVYREGGSIITLRLKN